MTEPLRKSRQGMICAGATSGDGGFSEGARQFNQRERDHAPHPMAMLGRAHVNLPVSFSLFVHMY